MKKFYEAPSVEKIAFAYRDQVVVASSDPITCSQTWDPANQSIEGGCKLITSVKDSGI